MLWYSSRSSTAEPITVSPGSSSNPPKPLLEVRKKLPRSYLAEVRVEKAVAAYTSQDQMRNSSATWSWAPFAAIPQRAVVKDTAGGVAAILLDNLVG